MRLATGPGRNTPNVHANPITSITLKPAAKQAAPVKLFTSQLAAAAAPAIGPPVEKRQFAVIGSTEYILPEGTIIASDALEFGDIMEIEEVKEYVLPSGQGVGGGGGIGSGSGMVTMSQAIGVPTMHGSSTTTTLMVHSRQSGETTATANEDYEDDEELSDDDDQKQQQQRHVIGTASAASAQAGQVATVFNIELLNSNSTADYSMNSSDAGRTVGGGGGPHDSYEELDGEEVGTSKDAGGGGDNDQKHHACKHCGKLYRWKSTLRRHEVVECGGKAPSYGCPYCDYKAKQHGNLGVHVRKHHPDQPQLASRRLSKKVKLEMQKQQQNPHLQQVSYADQTQYYHHHE